MDLIKSERYTYYLLYNIYIRFGSSSGNLLCPLVADLFLFYYKRDFMKSLTKEKRYDLIDAFNSISRCLNDLLKINNINFEHTLLPTPNWSPYMFTLAQKVKIRHKKFMGL